MNYHKIEKTSIANGEGIRVVLWVSGCSLHCRGCHNPSTWNVNSGKHFDETAKKELFEALDKPYIQGITFSGGHPLEDENLDYVRCLISEIKEKFPSKDIWLYTGYTWDKITMRLGEIVGNDNYKRFKYHTIIEQCDVVVDGAYVEEQRDITLKFRGSKNQRLIDVQKSLLEDEVILYHSKL